MTKKKATLATPALDFATEVRALREDLGLSQVEFAALCKISQPSLCALELGKYAPRLATILAIGKGSGRKVNIGDKNGKFFSRRRKK